MAYTKQNFVNDQTLNAEHLNHIEDGIASLDTNKADTGHEHPNLTLKTYGEGYSVISDYDGTKELYLDLNASAVGLQRLTSTADVFSHSGQSYNSGGTRYSFGYNNSVSGKFATAIGENNTASGDYSLAIGRENKSTKACSFMIGAGNQIVYSYDYAYCFIFGENNRIGFNEGDYFYGTRMTGKEEGYHSIALGPYNHVGYNSIVIGESNYAKNQGFTFGRSNCAYDDSIAAGSGSQALSNHAVAIGIGAIANANKIDENGNTKYSYYPNAFGYYSRATAGYTLAMGYCAYARASRAVGIQGDAEEEESVALGYSSYAHSKCSAALTPHTYATGENAVCIGYGATTKAKNAIAIGYETRIGETGEGVTAIGHFNDTAVTGCSTGTTGTALVIGNGTSNDARSNACRITFAGAVIGKAAYQSSGADYAEYFEWLDGNIDNEDRRGYFVTMDGNKIKKAKEGDYILGIVSAYPAVIGNNDMEWSGKFLLDEFGDPIKKIQKTIIKEHELNEDVHFTDEEMKTLTDEERKQREMREVEREVETEYFVLNPDFDPDREYIHRADRPEWDTIGMLGVLTVFDDGTCQVNGFCKCNNDGVATACERGFDTYRVIERINDRLIKVVFK